MGLWIFGFDFVVLGLVLVFRLVGYICSFFGLVLRKEVYDVRRVSLFLFIVVYWIWFGFVWMVVGRVFRVLRGLF